MELTIPQQSLDQPYATNNGFSATQSQNSPPNNQQLTDSAAICPFQQIVIVDHVEASENSAPQPPVMIGYFGTIPVDVVDRIFFLPSFINCLHLSQTCKQFNAAFSKIPYTTWLNNDGRELVKQGQVAQTLFRDSPQFRPDESLFIGKNGYEYAKNILLAKFGPVIIKKIQNGDMTREKATEAVKEAFDRIRLHLNEVIDENDTKIDAVSHILRQLARIETLKDLKCKNSDSSSPDLINAFKQEEEVKTQKNKLRQELELYQKNKSEAYSKLSYFTELNLRCFIGITKYACDGSLSLTTLPLGSLKLSNLHSVNNEIILLHRLLCNAEIAYQLDTNQLAMEEVVNNPAECIKKFTDALFIRQIYPEYRNIDPLEIATFLGVTVEKARLLRDKSIPANVLEGLTINEFIQLPETTLEYLRNKSVQKHITSNRLTIHQFINASDAAKIVLGADDYWEDGYYPNPSYRFTLSGFISEMPTKTRIVDSLKSYYKNEFKQTITKQEAIEKILKSTDAEANLLYGKNGESNYVAAVGKRDRKEEPCVIC